MVGVVEAIDANAEQQLNTHRNEETETVGDYIIRLLNKFQSR